MHNCRLTGIHIWQFLVTDYRWILSRCALLYYDYELFSVTGKVMPQPSPVDFRSESCFMCHDEYEYKVLGILLESVKVKRWKDILSDFDRSNPISESHRGMKAETLHVVVLYKCVPVESCSMWLELIVTNLATMLLLVDITWIYVLRTVCCYMKSYIARVSPDSDARRRDLFMPSIKIGIAIFYFIEKKRKKFILYTNLYIFL